MAIIKKTVHKIGVSVIPHSTAKFETVFNLEIIARENSGNITEWTFGQLDNELIKKLTVRWDDTTSIFFYSF